MKFSGDIDAVPEGTVVFPFEPLLRIQGPLIECQLLESPLLNLINYSSLVATKAARMCLAAKGEPVLEFGLRRAQGIDGALTASRSSLHWRMRFHLQPPGGKIMEYLSRGPIPIAGSWCLMMSSKLFRLMQRAFQTIAFSSSTLLTIEGVKKAIEVGLWLKERGKKLLGIRLDSGDLADLSIKSRVLLDQAGFQDAFIVASNELDETIIAELKRQGAPITVWGVGTNLVTAKDQPALDGVYKLSAIRDPGKNGNINLSSPSR